MKIEITVKKPVLGLANITPLIGVCSERGLAIINPMIDGVTVVFEVASDVFVSELIIAINKAFNCDCLGDLFCIDNALTLDLSEHTEENYITGGNDEE